MQGDILSAVLVVFVLTIELAHPSLEGFAFNLQACISATAAGALYMVLMHTDRSAMLLYAGCDFASHHHSAA